MSVLAFFENEIQQIRKVVDYANHNIYQLDDILDMMNNQKITPPAFVSVKSKMPLCVSPRIGTNIIMVDYFFLIASKLLSAFFFIFFNPSSHALKSVIRLS